MAAQNSYINPILRINLSHPPPGCAKHTPVTPGGPIRAQKQPKTPPRQAHFLRTESFLSLILAAIPPTSSKPNFLNHISSTFQPLQRMSYKDEYILHKIAVIFNDFKQAH